MKLLKFFKSISIEPPGLTSLQIGFQTSLRSDILITTNISGIYKKTWKSVWLVFFSSFIHANIYLSPTFCQVVLGAGDKIVSTSEEKSQRCHQSTRVTQLVGSRGRDRK